jgi:integrase/recombinase XerD
VPIPKMKNSRRLPEILSGNELERMFAALRNVKHRVLLMTTYAAGLRVSEVVQLKVTDIHSDRMMIRVEQGKGRKYRYTLLSKRLLEELRNYWKIKRPDL